MIVIRKNHAENGNKKQNTTGNDDNKNDNNEDNGPPRGPVITLEMSTSTGGSAMARGVGGASKTKSFSDLKKLCMPWYTKTLRILVV